MCAEKGRREGRRAVLNLLEAERGGRTVLGVRQRVAFVRGKRGELSGWGTGWG